MHNPKRQAGMTMWSLLFVLGTLAFFLFIIFKLFSPYMDDFKVQSALSSLGRQLDAASMSQPEIAEAIRKRLEIDSADNFNLADTMTIQMRGKTKVVRIKYETIVPLFFNISLLLDFDHVAELSGSK